MSGIDHILQECDDLPSECVADLIVALGGELPRPPATLDELLDEIQVIEIDEYVCDTNPGKLDSFFGWHAVSDGDRGMFAYFQDKHDAFRFRLDHINRLLNG